CGQTVYTLKNKRCYREFSPDNALPFITINQLVGRMIIDNVDALKSWLAKLLEPICDADPSALANYVVALVKKDKAEKELRALCADQLDVFLQKETTAFVNKLFECLTTKNYLAATKEETKTSAQKPEVKEETAPVEVDRDSRRRRSPPKNRPDFSESRARDDCRRDDRKQREQERHPKAGEPRERPERRGRSSWGRSHSRSRSRSGSRGKSRERGHNQRREHRSKFELERKEAEPYNPSFTHMTNPQHHQSRPCPLVPPPLPQHHFPSSGNPAVPKAATVAVPAHLPDSTTESWSTYFISHSDGKSFSKSSAIKHRCRDYDEKGFCIRGELCLFDHGNDPLIVDDVTLPNMIPFPPPPLLPRISIPPMTEPPPGMPMPHPPHGLPPPPGIYPIQNSYDPEAYNPESPGLTGPGRPQTHHFIPRVQTQRPNFIGLNSADGQSSRAANIVIQTEPSVSSVSSSEQESRKRCLPSTEEPKAKKPWNNNPIQNQSNPTFPKKNNYWNTKLVVCHIPPEVNNITKLNEHFSKFGTVVNIQVVFGGDPRAALIQYTANEEAHRAISSTEAVLNNRFIRVLWHKEGTFNSQEHNSISAAHKGIAPAHTAGSYVLNKTYPKNQTATGNPSSTGSTKPTSLSQEGAFPSLVKAPFSQSVLKASSKTLGKTDLILKKQQEALKLKQDMKTKMIGYQKVLINRLEKNPKMNPKERANLIKTMKEMSERISQLNNEINSPPRTATNTSQAKTKTDAQKELLDVELDFHKKLTSGEDTTDLKRQLGQLQVEATRLGLIPAGRGKPGQAPVRGRGRGRGRSLRGRGAANHMVIDHRPRALTVVGFTQEEKDELVPHFLKYGEIEEIRDVDACSAVMTFKTRSEAENAANHGAKFKGRILQLSWYKPKTPSVSTEPDEEESKEEVSAAGIHVMTEPVSPFLLPEDEEEDDDEEDEYESRSWRR
ncbi:hypothetical protein DNTS_025528, partial [Danionella cerebrum]